MSDEELRESIHDKDMGLEKYLVEKSTDSATLKNIERSFLKINYRQVHMKECEKRGIPPY